MAATSWGTAVIYNDVILLGLSGVLVGNLEGAKMTLVSMTACSISPVDLPSVVVREQSLNSATCEY